MGNPEKGYTVTQCVYVYKVKIQSNEILDKLKLIIVVRGKLNNKIIIWDTWSPKVSMRNMKYFFVDDANLKAKLHQLDFIGENFYKPMSNIEF